MGTQWFIHTQVQLAGFPIGIAKSEEEEKHKKLKLKCALCYNMIADQGVAHGYRGSYIFSFLLNTAT